MQPPAQNSGPPVIRWAVRLLRVAAVAAVAYFIARRLDLSALSGIDTARTLSALAMAQPFMLVAILLIGWRHSRMVATPPAPYFLSVKAIFLGTGLNLVLPARIPELLKASYLNERCGVPLSAGLAAVVVERLLDLAALVLIALAVTGLRWGDPSIYAAALVAAALLFVVTANAGRLAGPIVDRFVPARIAAMIQGQLANLQSVGRKVRQPSAWFVSVGAWLTNFGAVWVILNAVVPELATLRFACEVGLMMTLGLALPLLPGGLGTMEAAVQYVLVSAGVPPAQALFVALLLRIHNSLLPAAGAMAVILADGLALQSLIAKSRALLRTATN